ncbi:MAG: DUF3488 domain-containing protein [Oscillatoria sp. SIO1A7]|nr:DUF3488 domain-containing protein [Oscillatoria sp. SIO1A7]
MVLGSWQRIRSSKPVTENSILLRALVQALVIVGIVATDVAAETETALWAVPLSIAGATWSWHRRHKRNIAVKFLLAIGMLLALASFFGRLLGELNDTRVVLAGLLIQLQVLHSFDLPRRKDLGYSMAIGLILLGVAGTLSQTMAFAPMLLLFLALALPTLVLDYRSRLGLALKTPPGFDRESQKTGGLALVRSLLRSDLSPKRLGLFLLSAVSLGLLIFALLPRLPSYQLQTFPVSSSMQVQENLDGGSIFNPGYVNPGEESGEDNGEGSGGRTTGPGEVDDTFYYGFNTRMNQNLRGEMKPKVVMRVRSQAEGFWRVLAFDRYTGEGWEISRNEEVEEIKRSSWSYRFIIPAGQQTPAAQQVIQTYNIVSDLPNIIPALAEPKVLYFPSQNIEIDPEGNMLSPGRLADGLTYSAISWVPYRDRVKLGGASTDYPQDIREQYLQVPPEIEAKVRQFAEEIIQKRQQELRDNAQGRGRATVEEAGSEMPAYEKALYLAQYLKQRYAWSSNPRELPFLEPNEDLVEAFLFRWKWGYPDHYSTVLTVMLRSLGIPARLVVGFGPGQFNPFTGFYIVRNTDAYAMTEVYFPGHGWFAFDPIPGHDLIPPSVEDYETFSVLRQFWRWVAGWLPSPVTSVLQTVFVAIASTIFGAIAWLFGLLTRGYLGIFTFLILTSALGFLVWLAWNAIARWLYQNKLAKLPEMERLYREMLDILAANGYRKSPAQTPFEYARLLRSHTTPEEAAAIDEISEAYIRWRYGDRAPNYSQLQGQFQDLQERLKRFGQKIRM